MVTPTTVNSSKPPKYPNGTNGKYNNCKIGKGDGKPSNRVRVDQGNSPANTPCHQCTIASHLSTLICAGGTLYHIKRIARHHTTKKPSNTCFLMGMRNFFKAKAMAPYANITPTVGIRPKALPAYFTINNSLMSNNK